MRLRAYILKKFSQQMTLPGMFDRSRNEKIYYSPYNGEIDGEKYWNCYGCGNIIKDKDGNIVNEIDQIDKWHVEEHQEESQPHNVASLKENLIPQLEKLKNDIIKCKDLLQSEAQSEIMAIAQNSIVGNRSVYEIRGFVIDEVAKLSTKINSKTRAILGKEIQSIIPQIRTIFNYTYSGTEDTAKAYLNKISSIQFVNEYRINYFYVDTSQGVPEMEEIKDSIISFYRDKFDGQELLNYYQLINEIITFVNSHGDVLPTKENTFSIKRPICEKCAPHYKMTCENKKCGYSSEDEDDFVEVTVGKDAYKQLCRQYCAFHCRSCGKNIEGKDECINHDGDDYCRECFYEIYDNCLECSEIIYRDNCFYSEDDGPYCEQCFNDVQRSMESIDEDESRAVQEELAKPIANQINYPIDSASISGKILPLLETATKRGVAVGDLPSFFEARQATFGKSARLIMAAINSESRKRSSLEEVIGNFKRQLEELGRFKAEYPRLSEPKLLPVTIREESPRTGEGFVFALYPNENTFELAESIQPGARQAYKEYLSGKGHHKGALAYVRMGKDGNDNLIINNLQTDLDLQAFKTREEAVNNPGLVWWLQGIQKFWIPYLLDFARKVGKFLDKKVYLTSFEMQQRKWTSIPKRSMDAYESIPEQMGFVKEKLHTTPESLPSREYELTRIANLFIEAFKIIGDRK